MSAKPALAHRQHTAAVKRAFSTATISADGLYRYDLWRRWDRGPFVAFCGLNLFAMTL